MTDNHDHADLVSPDDACPTCGERDIDRLVWIDPGSDTVRCTLCGTEYQPRDRNANPRGGDDA